MPRERSRAISRRTARFASVCAVLLLGAAGCAETADIEDAGLLSGADALGTAHDAQVGPGTLAERCFVPLDTTREAYAERLRGLWLAESVANWTGLLTESERRRAPFYRDEDWGTPQARFGIEGSAMETIELNFLDPWGADDDTDVEMIYLEAMRGAGTAHLSPEQIRDAWRAHIVPDVYVWVSNRAARRLFDEPVEILPPSTSLLPANDQALMIDAQLTTELFGALAPGRPVHALELAQLPILTTATGFAAHAAQLHVALYALAPVVDPALSAREQIACLVAGARALIPDTSKTAHVVDAVLAAHAASSDRDDWERARDEIARVFQEEDAAHGHRYLEWYESSVNLATGLLALLFGEGELVRTIRIGTLSGWDSDNGTATMGGLLGLLRGEAWVRSELAAADHAEVSDRYRIARTRVGFPQETYTLAEIAELALPHVEESLRETGGVLEGARWSATRVTDAELDDAANPYSVWAGLSATALARRASDPSLGAQLVLGSLGSDVALSSVLDGLEHDASGHDPQLDVRDEARLASEALPERCVTLRGDVDARVSVEVTWTTEQPLRGARYVEGRSDAEGGWLESPTIEVLTATGWSAPTLSGTLAPREGRAFEILDASFAATARARGVRLSGLAGGPRREATLCELDGVLATD